MADFLQRSLKELLEEREGVLYKERQNLIKNVQENLSKYIN